MSKASLHGTMHSRVEKETGWVLKHQGKRGSNGVRTALMSGVI